MSTFNGSRVNALANALSNNIEANNPLSSEEALAYFKDNGGLGNAIRNLGAEYLTSHFTDNASGLDKYLNIPFTIPMKNIETGETEEVTLYFKAALNVISNSRAKYIFNIGKYVCTGGIEITVNAESGDAVVLVSPMQWLESGTLVDVPETWYEIDF